MSKERKIPKNADNLMSYVTQGTVHIERRTKTDAKLFINPTPDYAVRHNEKDYIIFVDVESTPPQSQLFERKTKCFPIEEEHFIQMLTEAAFQRTKIEIRVNADCTEIVALKIPAAQ